MYYIYLRHELINPYIYVDTHDKPPPDQLIILISIHRKWFN